MTDTRTRTQRALIIVAAFGVLALWMLAMVPRSTLATATPRRPNAEVLSTAQAAVDSMERDGAIVERTCEPNMTIVKGAMWRSLPADRYRKIAARSLALLCEQEGAERSMTVYSERGDWLGRYDEDDSYETTFKGAGR